MKLKLTTKLLDGLMAKGEPRPPIWDSATSGFGVRVGKRTISFFAVRRQRGGSGRPIRIPLGHYPLVTLGDARLRANAILRDLHDGVDPRQREIARLQAEAARQQNTFAAVAEEFITRHALGKKTGRAIELLVRRELIPRWGGKLLGEVSATDVVDLLDQIKDRGHPAAAHQIFGYCKRLYSWALARPKYGLQHSPFDRLKRGELLGPKCERQRLLSPGELRLIWAATEGDIYPDNQFIRLLLLLAVRRGELARARWSEFDLDVAQPTWVIPGGLTGRMKNNDPHLVPLPAAAVAILKSLPRFAGCDFLFSARGEQALNDFVGLKQRLDAAVTKLNGGQPIEPWVLHDTRRCVRTNLSALRIEPHVAERILGHRQGGIGRVYDLWQFADEKREALQAWASRLLAIVEPPTDNIVPMRRQA
jgi:integrase